MAARRRAEEDFDFEVDEGAPRGLSAKERLAWRRARAHARPTLATVAAGLCGLLALLLTPALYVGFSFLAHSLGAMPSNLQQVLMLPLVLSVLLLAAGIGLVFVRPLAWWTAVLGAAFVLVDLLRIALPVVLAVKSDHPRAMEAYASIGAAVALPACLAIGILSLLSAKAVRAAYR